MNASIMFFLSPILALLYVGLRAILGVWPADYDLFGCGILLLVFGIPHGAGDHLIGQKIASELNRVFSLKKFIMKYLFIMAVYAVAWYFFPMLSFVIFILISIFHFGDLEDLSNFDVNRSKWMDYFQIMARGTGILGIIIFFHWDEVLPILQAMKVSLNDSISSFPKSLFFLSYFLGFRKQNLKNYLTTLSTLLLGIFLPLIPAFILFFTCCHALYSFDIMMKRLHSNFFEIYKKLLPYSISAFFILFFYIYLIDNELPIAQLFVFLSLITLPHFLLMHLFIKYVN